MWNLTYGQCGKVVALGVRRRQKQQPKVKRHNKLPKKARKAYRICVELAAVPRSERLTFLKLSLAKGAAIPAALIAERRAEFNQHKRRLLPIKRAKCYVCREKAAHRHHVIPIYRGGSNKKSNLVPLCIECHWKLHPWLKENLNMAAGILPATARDFEVVETNHFHNVLSDSTEIAPGPVGAGIR